MITTTTLTIPVPNALPADSVPAIPGDIAAIGLPEFAQLLVAAIEPAADPTTEPVAKPAAKRAKPQEAPDAPVPAGVPSNLPLPVPAQVEIPAAPGAEPDVQPKPGPKIEARLDPKSEPKTEPKLQVPAAPPLQSPAPSAPAEVAAPVELPSTQPVAPATAALAPAAPAYAAAPAHAAHPLHVAVPLGAPGFDEAFAARVTVAVRAGAESASIAINPPELGPVEMRVRVADGEAHVQFAAGEPLAREAIAEALPRLREMLSAQGLSLADASVGAELPRRGSPAQEALPRGGAGGPAPQESEAALAERAGEVRLVDVFA
jgi:flagellar hook-length control protein FliK